VCIKVGGPLVALHQDTGVNTVHFTVLTHLNVTHSDTSQHDT